MQRILSISGLRGVIGDGLDPSYIAEFAMAMGTIANGGKIVVTRDGRATGVMVQAALFAGLTATGCHVIDAGIASTPTCGVLIQHLEADGGIQITASHNPVQWNGLKAFSREGSVFDQQRGSQLVDILERKEFHLKEWSKIGDVSVYDDPHQPHLEKVLNLVDVAAIRNRNFKVVLDCNHGSGAVLGPRLLKELGCQVEVLGETADGRFAHTPEPIKENLEDVARYVRDFGAAVGFAQDPDADRLAIMDENGRYLGEELTLALCVDHILGQTPGPIVVNGSTSRINADLAAKYHCEFYRSAVGEANVVDKMKEVKAIIGGEGNGGVIEPQVGFVRDSFVSMAYVLDRMSKSTETLSQWVDSLPRYAIVKDKVTCPQELLTQACAALKEAFSDAQTVEGDGLRLDWEDRWLQVRASNTEPIVRVIAEAPSDNDARELCHRGKEIVRGIVPKQ